jgi:hypothetical protein
MRKIRNIEKSQPFAGVTPPGVWRGHPSETFKIWQHAATRKPLPDGRQNNNNHLFSVA